MNTSKVTIIEVIDLTRAFKSGERSYTEYRFVKLGKKDIEVTLSLQDSGRTLKIFISKKTNNGK